MACFHPLRAWKVWRDGKSEVLFNEKEAVRYRNERMELPCGQCVGCRVDRCREWALRCMHEASLHDENCFVTLTYDDDHLPDGGSVSKRDLQCFFKRLRSRHEGVKLRYFACGEYGDSMMRPHYHFLLFGFEFLDKELSHMQGKYPVYVSAELASLWPVGYHLIGDVTMESAAYVTRYAMKKVNGVMALDRYVVNVDEETGDATVLEPEFVLMSRGRKPDGGIGCRWLTMRASDCYPKGFVTVDGMKYKVPAYYDRLYEAVNPEMVVRVKYARRRRVVSKKDDATLERLGVREVCLKAREKCRERR